MSSIRVALGERSYPIHIGRTLTALPFFLRTLPVQKRGLLVADAATVDRYARPLQKALKTKGFFFEIHGVPSGERSKNTAEWNSILRHAAKLRLERTSPFIALGGGVVGDLTGFAAASFLRGVPVIHVPTTLLAMVDSSIGGKAGIDLPEGKNLAGAFHQPLAVWMDPHVLQTLPVPHLRNGMAEIIKYGVIAEEEFFAFLEENIVSIYNLRRAPLLRALETSARIKARIVSADEKEKTGLRATLNFGHTLGHAVEAAAGYRGLLHGEAVAIGMHAAGFISWRTGRWSIREFYRMLALIAKSGLPCRLKRPLSKTKVEEFLKRDKKVKSSQVLFALPDRIGHVTAGHAVPSSILQDVLAEIGVRS